MGTRAAVSRIQVAGDTVDTNGYPGRLSLQARPHLECAQTGDPTLQWWTSSRYLEALKANVTVSVVFATVAMPAMELEALSFDSYSM